METIVLIAILIAVIWVVKIFLSNGGEDLIRSTTKTANMNVQAWNAKAEAHAATTLIEAYKDFDQKKVDDLNQSLVIRKEIQDILQ